MEAHKIPDNLLQSIFDQIEARTPKVRVTYALIAINVLVFLVMLTQGAGLLHSPNDIQLNWGANFGPATQDGQWWRLGSAIFLHFGAMHLLLNSIALWDVGKLTERMFGPWRLLGIYLIAGLFGNILSLDIQGNEAVSGGASGAIFGLYGALLIFLWRERDFIDRREFKWLFGGAVGFSILTITLGFVMPGIDNAAHIGGFIAGIVASIIFARPINARAMPMRFSIGAAVVVLLASTALLANLPAPKYKWSDELLLRAVIGGVVFENQAINRSWLNLQNEQNQGDLSFEDLAGKIETDITEPYEGSFEKLSQLPKDPNLPSAKTLEYWLELTQAKKNKSEALVEDLRKQNQ
jgi:rhomboid protease GluP